MSSRDAVLGAVRASLRTGGMGKGNRADLDRSIAEHPRNTVPRRGTLPTEERVRLFIHEAETVNATTDRLAKSTEAPAAIARYLAENNLPARLKLATDPLIQNLPWSKQSTLQTSTGPARDGDAVSVSAAFGGVAETGTLVLLSSPENPTTLNFLPDTHIVILPVSRLEGAYEDVWSRLREQAGGAMPRTVNWITGPSRTADIEQTLLLGAHGPRQLHIVILEDA